MHGTERRIATHLKDLFWRRANRGIKAGSKEFIQTQIERRLDAQVRLQGLHRNRRIIFFLPDVTETELRQALYTLRVTDLWNKGGRPFDGDVEAHANRIAESEAYEEDYDEIRQENSRRDENRYVATETYHRAKSRAGERLHFTAPD
jgi:hypothetical protein